MRKGSPLTTEQQRRKSHADPTQDILCNIKDDMICHLSIVSTKAHRRMAVRQRMTREHEAASQSVVDHMVRTAMKISIGPKQRPTQCGFELSLSDSLLCFVNEQMRSLNMSNVTEYIAKLVSEERARTALQEDVRLAQLEIR